MKSFRYIILLAVVACGVFGTVLYSSCTKNACKGITCLYGGTCSGGLCTGCPTGIVGQNCETVCELLYTNIYTGNAAIDSSGTYITDTNNILTFSQGPDSQYTQMNLAWYNPAFGTVQFAVTLTSFAPGQNSSTVCPGSGSTFTLDTVTVDTSSFGGSGSVNGTVASVTLIERHPNSPPEYISLTNFNKQ